jgi:hypothetical protein
VRSLRLFCDRRLRYLIPLHPDGTEFSAGRIPSSQLEHAWVAKAVVELPPSPIWYTGSVHHPRERCVDSMCAFRGAVSVHVARGLTCHTLVNASTCRALAHRGRPPHLAGVPSNGSPTYSNTSCAVCNGAGAHQPAADPTASV